MNASLTTDTPPPRTAPLALWRVAEAFMHTLYNLFGAPEDVAEKHTLMADAHARLASWLRCAEALLRRLLLIEAAAYAKPNTRPLLHAKRVRVRRATGFDADAPEAWRVSFRCFVGDTHAPAAVHRMRRHVRRACVSPTKHRFRSAWPLAERYEALIRVFNAPAAYARRLAQRLHATPHRIREVLRAPPEAHHRIDQFDALSAWARNAVGRRDSS